MKDPKVWLEEQNLKKRPQSGKVRSKIRIKIERESEGRKYP